MRKRLFSWIFVLGMFFYTGNFVFAQTAEEEIADLKKRILKLEQRLSKQENRTVEVEKVAHGAKREVSELIGYTPGKGVQIESAELAIGAGATFVFQSTNNANVTGSDHTDASYSMDLELEKGFGDKGLAFLHLETGAGAGVEDDLEVFSNVNRDADDSDNSVSVTEAWYEYDFKRWPIIVTVGKIDPSAYIDTNAYANDECAQFLGHVFRNSPVLEFPDDNSVGLRCFIEPVDLFSIELVAMDANADWSDIFDDMFFAGELTFKADFFEKQGNYRVYGWLNDKDHVKWKDPFDTDEKGYGFGLSFDQEVTDTIGGFVRYGWKNPKSYSEGEGFSLEQSWSIGFQVLGSVWHRDDDVFGLAFGQVIPSDDYKKASNLKAETESHLEIYYNMKINDHLSISPDLQFIWLPYGGDAFIGEEMIFVGGLRAQIDF